MTLEKLKHWCAYQERCQQEARDKLFALGLKTGEVEQVVAALIADGFIDEERYALAFAGGKFRIKKWGRIKIKMMLKQKRISDYSISKALQSIDEQEYLSALEKIIVEKKRALRSETSKIRRNYKLLRYVQSKGYETDLAMELLKEEA